MEEPGVHVSLRHGEARLVALVPEVADAALALA